MTYKNIRTGAVINSPCVICGDDWIELTKAADRPKKDAQKHVPAKQGKDEQK